MGSVSRFDVVQLCQHRDGGCTGNTRHRGGEQNIDLHCLRGKRFGEEIKQYGERQLCEQAYDDREADQLDRGVQIQLGVRKHLRQRDGSKQCSRDQNRDGGAEIAEVGKETAERVQYGHQRAVGWDVNESLAKENHDADRAGDGAVVEEDLFRRELDVVSAAREDHNAPRPKEQVEADNVKRAHKASDAVTEDRVENGEADESRIGKDEGKLEHLVLIGILFEQLTKEECHERHERVHDRTDYDDLPCDGDVRLVVFCLCQRADDHHRLSDRNDQLGKRLGGIVVDDTLFTAEITANHQQKEREDDGEQGKEEIVHAFAPPASSSFALMRFISSSMSSFLRGSRSSAAG